MTPFKQVFQLQDFLLKSESKDCSEKIGYLSILNFGNLSDLVLPISGLA